MHAWGIIFDMDGTLMDNNPYHLKAWQAFCEKRGRRLTEEEYLQQVSGKNNEATLQYLFPNEEWNQEKLSAAKAEKESLYRTLYAPYIKPINGLEHLMRDLKLHDIPIAVATSAMPENIQFAWEHLPITPYIDVIVDSSQVKHGKPAPDLYWLAAEKIKVPPQKCMVFEDSLNGVQGALAAGMYVVAITTSHGAEAFPRAHQVIHDYVGLSHEKLYNWIKHRLLS
ncbi:HAD family hydrolase [Thermoflavifilum thermophilum]|uniref:Haloacid dehalogenase superfamily, subfamily IA, variant 3 with third motif having DD or ED/beta-phosphoglucomutase family hydrolase n=1 Tax=Thermoflavifilum thermophilum TaxID=1393122 RepID=A0A1I7NHS2_9BACT|nr:HAD family phosphatase [Thermoflavifilum thermophilum]SFV34211.1 haloacid dehalogenase superfamily, subfamily IA, variant 3 with third motif having DD or ED/beta-phosphoglucomutase family hydrolase [Thermoflavifilum thermophilum]